MMTINIWWLLLIIPVSVIAGFVLALFYFKKLWEKQMLKMIGFKSMKDLYTQAKKSQKLPKEMSQGDTRSKMLKLFQDPEMKKQLEELQKRFKKGKDKKK